MNTTTTTQKHSLTKEKSYAFKKDIYLLGVDEDGTKYWLEAPKWDCGWYWGFGYVETYINNNNPSKSRDIASHQHIDSSFLGRQECGEYIHNIYDCPKLAATTFDENTGWIISELFNEFYTLKKTAELFHTTKSPLQDLLKNPDMEKHINEVLIPAITAKIIELLTP